jgi:hypothetical protein
VLIEYSLYRLSLFWASAWDLLNQKKLTFRVKGIDIESPKIDCLSFVYVPATSAAHNSLLFCFFAAAIYSTNEENMRR